MKTLNTTPGVGFLCPLFLEPMLIKPTYDKFYRIIYTRGKDKQTTDIVEATEEQVKDLVTVVIKGCTFHPAGKSGVTPSTNVQLWEYNSLTKQCRLCREFPKVFNQSPRQVRIGIEEAIKVLYNEYDAAEEEWYKNKYYPDPKIYVKGEDLQKMRYETN